jgi:hypothetical protein
MSVVLEPEDAAGPEDAGPGRAPLGSPEEPPDGSTALLQGLMSMLSEVLAGLDRRLAHVEAAVGVGADGAQGAEGVSSVMSETLARLEQLTTAVDALGYGLASLSEAVASPPAPQAEGLRSSVMALESDVADLGAAVREVAVSLEETRDRLAALTEVLESRETASGVPAEGTVSSLGRMATEAGRRLAADLRSRARGQHQEPRPPEHR